MRHEHFFRSKKVLGYICLAHIIQDFRNQTHLPFSKVQTFLYLFCRLARIWYEWHYRQNGSNFFKIVRFSRNWKHKIQSKKNCTDVAFVLQANGTYEYEYKSNRINTDQYAYCHSIWLRELLFHNFVASYLPHYHLSTKLRTSCMTSTHYVEVVFLLHIHLNVTWSSL